MAETTQAPQRPDADDIAGWLSLALVHARSGNKPAALYRYTLAVEWMDESGHHDAKLDRLRDEVAAVLSLPESCPQEDREAT